MEDPGSILGLGISPGEGNGNPIRVRVRVCVDLALFFPYIFDRAISKFNR